MLVTKSTQDAIIELIGRCYQENRYLDRLVSVLGVKFAYNNTANLVHHGISHMYPRIADTIGEKCLERYNIPVFYPATTEGGQDYASVREVIKDLEERTIDFQIMLMGVCKLSQENGDIHVYIDLLDVLEDYNKVVEQVILMSDKIESYNGSVSYDAHIKEHFWILGEV